MKKMIASALALGTNFRTVRYTGKPTKPARVKPINCLLVRLKATEMFSEAVDSFVRKDNEQATAVRAKDDIVDQLFSKVIMEMSGLLGEDKSKISQATDYMFIAKYIERMADHATNVAEWTIYAVTGEHKNMSNKLLGSQPKLA